MGREKSIDEIIERAKDERKRLLDTIDNLLKIKIPDTSYDLSIASEFLENLSKEMGLKYSKDSDAQDILRLYTEKLTALKKDLEEFIISEESLLSNGSSIINRAQEVVPLVEPALKQIKSRFYNLEIEKIMAEYRTSKENERNKNEEIKELEIKKAYIEGQLSIVKRKKERQNLENEIKSIDEQIERIKIESAEKEENNNKQEHFEEGKAQEEIDER